MKKHLNDIFRLLVLVSFLFLVYSCDVMKNSQKTKSDSDFTESIESQSYRKGDTVHFEIPNVIYKDTTIYRTNRQGTTIRTEYDNSGKIASIDCFASAIAEIKKENRQFQQSVLEKDKVKTEKFDSSFIFYIVGGVVLIVFFALFLMFLYVKKNTAVVTNFLK